MEARVSDSELLESAYAKISLLADQTWWTETDKSDAYRLSNLNLWVSVVRTSAELKEASETATGKLAPGANQATNCTGGSGGGSSASGSYPGGRTGTGGPSYNPINQRFRESLQCRENPYSRPGISDFPEDIRPVWHDSENQSWLMTHSWPISLLRSYPLISHIVQESVKPPHSLYSYNNYLEMQLENRDLVSHIRHFSDDTNNASMACANVTNGQIVQGEIDESYPGNRTSPKDQSYQRLAPYKMTTLEEVRLYNNIQAVKNIWKQERLVQKSSWLLQARDALQNSQSISDFFPQTPAPMLYPSVAQPNVAGYIFLI